MNERVVARLILRSVHHKRGKHPQAKQANSLTVLTTARMLNARRLIIIVLCQEASRDCVVRSRAINLFHEGISSISADLKVKKGGILRSVLL